MYELPVAECQRRLGLVDEVRNSMEQQFREGFVCDCNEASRERSGELFVRIHAGDMAAMDELLEFFRGCIDQWAADLFKESEAEQVCYKAKLAAVLKSRASELTEDNFSYELHMLAVNEVKAQLKHVIKWHERQKEAEETPLNS